MINIDSESFTIKSKKIIYIEAFVKRYNQKNCRPIEKIYEMIEFKKMHILISKNLCNLSTYQIIEISSNLPSSQVVPKN